MVLLGLVLVFVLVLCSIVRAGFPVVVLVTSAMVVLMVVAGGGGMAMVVIGGGAIVVGGLVLATASEVYDQTRLTRRRARPRRHPRVTTGYEAEPGLEKHSRAA